MQYHNESFDKCKSDRAKLNEIEYEGNSEFASLLGNIELSSDAVAGFATAIIDGKSIVIDNPIDALYKSSVFQPEAFARWITLHGSEYRDFCNYVASVEFLRMALLVIIKLRG